MKKLIPGQYYFRSPECLGEINGRLYNPWLDGKNSIYDHRAKNLKICLMLESEKQELIRTEGLGLKRVYSIPVHRAEVVVGNASRYQVDDPNDMIFHAVYNEGWNFEYVERDKKLSFLADGVTLTCVVTEFSCSLQIERTPSTYFERSVYLGGFERTDLNPV